MNQNFNKLYLIAESQAGYFTSTQARSAGFSAPLLHYHTRSGRFQRIAPRVYRLTHFPGSPYEDLFIAWLRTGPHSVISHDSALALYDLSDALPTAIHVTVPRTASRRRPGLRLHTQRLESDDVTRYKGLPVTTVSRTIADVAFSGLADELVIQAIHEALARGLTTESALRAMAGRRGGRMARLLSQALSEELVYAL
jgi:predicted transcriptional regulator of viral defense system